MTKTKNAPATPKNIAQEQVNGHEPLSPELVEKYLLQDVNTAIQCLFMIREDKEVRDAVTKALFEKYMKTKDHV